MATGAAVIDRRPWEALPAELAQLFRPRLEPLADEIVEAIRASVPAYARPPEGEFGAALRAGVLGGLEQFVDLLEHPGARERPGRRLYVALGRGEAREGRTLESLLSAYRIGARMAWRKIADEGRAAGLDADTLALLAEAIFAYIDELSADSAEGWAEERSAAAGELERRRAALVSLLTQRPPAEPATVETAAREAGWTPPAAVAVLVWTSARSSSARGGRGPAPAAASAGDAPAAAGAPERRSEGAGDARAAGGAPERRPVLPPGTISAASDDGTVIAVVPDAGAPTRRTQLARALAGHVAALGPVVPWTDAARSARRARAAHRLAVEGVLSGDRLVVTDRHLPALLLHSEPALLGELAERALAPLAHRTPAARRRLADTLRALIDHQGRAPDAAAALHVHPQTVRYRLAQLREDFGDALDDPDRRFELALALRAGKL